MIDIKFFKLSIIIPCYNEVKTIEKVLDTTIISGCVLICVWLIILLTLFLINSMVSVSISIWIFW